MTKKHEPTPEERQKQSDAIRKLYGLKPWKLPKKPNPSLGLALALFVAPAASWDLWIPMGGNFGAYTNQRGEIAMPLGGNSNAYVMPDDSLVVRQRGGAYTNNGTSYVGGGGLYSGTDGSVVYVTPRGDLFNFGP